MIIYQFGRCLRPVLFAHTAQALATRPVSASIANAVLISYNLLSGSSRCKKRIRLAGWSK